MAITFLEKRKKQKFLIPLLATIILLTGLVIWGGFFEEEEPQIIELEIKRPVRKIEINLQLLEDPIFEQLQAFEKIAPFEEEAGRENPFLPY